MQGERTDWWWLETASPRRLAASAKLDAHNRTASRRSLSPQPASAAATPAKSRISDRRRPGQTLDQLASVSFVPRGAASPVFSCDSSPGSAAGRATPERAPGSPEQQAPQARTPLLEHSPPATSLGRSASLDEVGTLRTRLARPRRVNPYFSAEAVDPSSRRLAVRGVTRSQVPSGRLDTHKQLGFRHTRGMGLVLPHCSTGAAGGGGGPRHQPSSAHGLVPLERPRSISCGSMTVAITKRPTSLRAQDPAPLVLGGSAGTAAASAAGGPRCGHELAEILDAAGGE